MHCSQIDVLKTIDGDFTGHWSTSCSSGGSCLAKNWMRIKLNNMPDDTRIYLRSVRIYYDSNHFGGLVGAEVRVGNGESFSDGDHTVCATIQESSQSNLFSGTHRYLDLACKATGNYIFLVQPNPKCLTLSELEVVGIRHGCTKCAADFYSDRAGSTSCSSCPWAWDENAPWRATSGEMTDTTGGCVCRKGYLGRAGGLFQHNESFRPILNGSSAVHFNRSKTQFLFKDWHLDLPHPRAVPHRRLIRLQSAGGLTIVARVKFSGIPGYGESVVSLSNEMDSFAVVLARHHASSRIWFGVDACSVQSGAGVIIQEEWMTLLAEYNSATNNVTLYKDGSIIAGPTPCTQAPRDRQVSNTFVGKSNIDSHAYFNGQIQDMYVAVELLRNNMTRICNRSESNMYEANCSTLQSSTWTAEAGNQYFRDQGIRGVEGSPSADAANAVDGRVGTCSQTWRESWPWWRVDLEDQRLVVSLRVYGRTDCCQGELEGFEVRVGNWPTWEQNSVCATGQRAPTNGQRMDVLCQAEGRYVFVVLPGINRTLVLCDVEVIGLSNAASSTVINGLIPRCTSCISGTGLRLLPLAQDLPVRMG